MSLNSAQYTGLSESCTLVFVCPSTQGTPLLSRRLLPILVVAVICGVPIVFCAGRIRHWCILIKKLEPYALVA